MRTTIRGGVLAIAAFALLASACGGADDGGLGDLISGDDDTPAAGGDAALLGVLEPGVDVRESVAAEYLPGVDGDDLFLGEAVRTDATGFAQIGYPDGSLTRLDVDTEFEIVALSSDAGQEVSSRLDAGRAWNRVKDVSGGSFEVDTSVGVAAVRGTAFDVDCRMTCTYSVFEGIVLVTTSLGIEVELQAGETVTVDEDGIPGDIQPADYDDPWVAQNIDRDEQDDPAFVRPIEPEDSGRDEAAQSRLEGEYEIQGTITSSSTADEVGDPVQRTYVFTPDCSTGPCGGSADIEGFTTPYTWNGRGYTMAYAGRPYSYGNCPTESDYVETWVATITPVEIQETEDGPYITTFEIVWETEFVTSDEALAAGCEQPTYTAEVEGAGTLVGQVDVIFGG